MHLVYHNSGHRFYGEKPIAVYPRERWAIQAVLRGSCTFLFERKGVLQEVRITKPTLTIAGGQCAHGWSGKRGDACDILVWHFDEANYALQSIIGSGGVRCVHFSKSQIPILNTWSERCRIAYSAIDTMRVAQRRRLGFSASLIYETVLAELTLFLIEHIPHTELGPTPDFGEQKVAQALAWYEANLANGVTITEVAEAVHLSPTHLRRLFHLVKGCSPQVIFTRIQFERAKWLMRDSTVSLESIAESVGFGSASAFSRAFRTKFGFSPKIFRDRL